MKKRILLGCAGLLLASSTMFAGWGDRGYDHHERYERRGGVYVGVAPGYAYGYAPEPYVNPYDAPVPYDYEYAAPAPYYGGAWVSGGWGHERRDGNWGRSDWRHHRER